MTEVSERPLPGGNIGGAVRAGDTVRRSTGPWTPAVHALLRHLESAGFAESPRVLGLDERDREVLTFIEGETVGDTWPWPSWTRDDDLLVQAGQLLRRYHEAVSSFRPEGNLRWRFASGSLPPGQIVCHNDAGVHNVVVRGGRIVGLIDWDVAGPDEPSADLAFAAWSWVPLHDPSLLPAHGWTEPPDQHRRLRLLLDAYGLDDRTGFAAAIPRRIRTSVERMEGGADTGDPGLQCLREAGYLDDMRRTIAHLDGRVEELQAAIER